MEFEENLLGSDSVQSVSGLLATIRRLLESGHPLGWVRGEISTLSRPASGHWYFVLKDGQAQVRCVMFRSRNSLLRFQVEAGQLVEVRALATLYEARGEFQLTVEQMRPAGQGDLAEQFERLKQRLAAEGLFDTARKRTIPVHPVCIGVVTSAQAAALRDVLATLRQRAPGVRVILYPTLVQGSGSVGQIVEAIGLAGRRAECDTLIVCRGGGSQEDLWSFNDEAVVRAVARCPIPVISGVGHETDVTLTDFVADERAATPTAAAQRAVPDHRDQLQRVTALRRRFARALLRQTERGQQALDYLQRRLVHPARQLQQRTAWLDALARRLQREMRLRLQDEARRCQAGRGRLRIAPAYWQVRQQALDRLALRLTQAGRGVLQRQEMAQSQFARQLAMLDPRNVLARGYVLVQDARGGVVPRAADLQTGERVRLQFSDGWVEAGVLDGGKAP